MHLVKYKIAESSLTIEVACMLIWSSQYKVYNYNNNNNNNLFIIPEIHQSGYRTCQ